MADPGHLANIYRRLHRHVIFAGTMASCLGSFCEVRPSLMSVNSSQIHSHRPAQSRRQTKKKLCLNMNKSRRAIYMVPSSRSGSNTIVLFLIIIMILRFIETNPGRQMISGSFNPIDYGDWTAEAYQSSTS